MTTTDLALALLYGLAYAVWGYVFAMVWAESVWPSLVRAWREGPWAQARRRREFEVWAASLTHAERTEMDRIAFELVRLVRETGLTADEAARAFSTRD